MNSHAEEKPRPGVNQDLIIARCHKRGTIYDSYDL